MPKHKMAKRVCQQVIANVGSARLIFAKGDRFALLVNSSKVFDVSFQRITELHEDGTPYVIDTLWRMAAYTPSDWEKATGIHIPFASEAEAVAAYFGSPYKPVAQLLAEKYGFKVVEREQVQLPLLFSADPGASRDYIVDKLCDTIKKSVRV